MYETCLFLSAIVTYPRISFRYLFLYIIHHACYNITSQTFPLLYTAAQDLKTTEISRGFYRHPKRTQRGGPVAGDHVRAHITI